MTFYEVRRETIKTDECVFRGEWQECVDWMQKVAGRAKEYLVLTDVYMNPVFDIGTAAFYMRQI